MALSWRRAEACAYLTSNVCVAKIFPWKVPLRKAITSGRPDAAAAGAMNATREADTSIMIAATPKKMRKPPRASKSDLSLGVQ